MRKALGATLMGIVVLVQCVLVLLLIWSIGWSLWHRAWLSLLLWLVLGGTIITILGSIVTLPLMAAASRLLRLPDEHR